MFSFLLFAASLFPSQQGCAQCVDRGTRIAVTETQPVRGPSGTTAVLKVSTSDDHGKDSHLCNAEYQLLIMPAADSTPVVADLLTANDDYGRSLSLRLDGFTQDGSQILGILSETWKRTATFLFEYEITNGNIHLVDLTHEFARITTAGCSHTFAVLGTFETGAIIMELNSAKPCLSGGRWMLDSASGKPLRFPRGVSFRGLYESKTGVQ